MDYLVGRKENRLDRWRGEIQQPHGKLDIEGESGDSVRFDLKSTAQHDPRVAMGSA